MVEKKVKIDIDDVKPEEVGEYEDSIRKNLSELNKILTGECNEKYLTDFKDSIDEIVKRAKLPIKSNGMCG